MMARSRLLELKKPIIGMVHLPPLPGSPGYRGNPLEEIVRFAVREAKALEEGGIDAILIENFHDYPYPLEKVPTPTLIAMAVVAQQVKEETNVPVGVNLLFNDFENELYLAWCLGLDFIRVEGFVDLLFSDMGPLFPAAPKLMRLKQELGAEGVAILADVQGKYTQAFPARDVADSARDAIERGRADAVVLTGARTGQTAPLEMVRHLKSELPAARVLLGSGITPEMVADFLGVADGAIVGSYFKYEGNVHNPVDPERVRRLMEAARKARGRR
ncbi:MAG: BtpA/SgcQ family protein [Candidatus Bipolaricaulaceae bacterium]|uniref:BtpA/SgcQ family protein n=1 Tax=Candidatus Hadarchaeum sp. TaxID=2883567 RepID=UPI003D13C7CB